MNKDQNRIRSCLIDSKVSKSLIADGFKETHVEKFYGFLLLCDCAYVYALKVLRLVYVSMIYGCGIIVLWY